MPRVRIALAALVLVLVLVLSAGGLGAATAWAQGRTLVVGSSATYPPFAYETPAKEIVGFDVDIIKAVARKAGLTVRIVNTPFTGIFASLNNGDVDLIVSGVTINERRRQSYDFTAPYFEARQLIAVPVASTVTRLQDLQGKKVAVVTGSTGDDVASRAFGKTSPNIRRFDTTPLIIAELVAYGVDAAIGDNGVIAYRVQEQKTLKTVDDPSFPKEYFGIVVKQGNAALKDTLNAGLAGIIDDGTYARLYRQWFKTEPPVLPKR
ncbi:MAG TPA: basic amino acid ABC transporter substrate-binding protein [Vicinamibacterales bacterium]|nr:basic amino acid ABC transporter substrate-binding protein [Vicinamibacterales bacterium]